MKLDFLTLSIIENLLLKLIASGGDAVSNAGKNIIHSAHLIEPESSGKGQKLVALFFSLKVEITLLFTC